MIRQAEVTTANPGGEAAQAASLRLHSARRHAAMAPSRTAALSLVTSVSLGFAAPTELKCPWGAGRPSRGAGVAEPVGTTSL